MVGLVVGAGLANSEPLRYNLDETQDNASFTRKLTQSIFQYGAIGLMLAVIVWKGVWLLNTFVPIWIEHFHQDDVARVNQTATLRQIASTMEAMQFDMKTGREAISTAIVNSCKKGHK